MEKKIVVSKRFRKNSLEVFDFFNKGYSQKTTFHRKVFANNCTGTSMANAQKPFATKLAPIEGNIKIVKIK